jgi:hypothetical protein
MSSKGNITAATGSNVLNTSGNIMRNTRNRYELHEKPMLTETGRNFNGISMSI